MAVTGIFIDLFDGQEIIEAISFMSAPKLFIC